ncbi:MAG: hypothetical protein AB7K24_07920 [Gemmataceae bacterium]
MSEENSVVGSYKVEASKNVSMVARGDTLSIRAISETGNVLVDATQTVSIMANPAFVAIESDGVSGKAVVSAGELGTLIHCVGPPLAGAQIRMTPETVNITCGAPGTGASISMTPESITFKVGEVTMSITPAGITEDIAEVTRESTPEGHNFTAGEAEFNLGVEGEATEAPTSSAELEGASIQNETASTHTVDAVKNETAAMEITE